MRRSFGVGGLACVLLLLVLPLLSGCDGQLPWLGHGQGCGPINTWDWADRAIYRPGLIRAEQATLEQLPGASIYHMELQITTDFSVQGLLRVRYTNQEQVALPDVFFRLLPNIQGGATTIAGVRVDGKATPFERTAQNAAMRVPLPAPLQPDGRTVIEIDFSVQTPREMGGNYGLFGYLDGVLVLDQFYPVIPVYDERGWQADPPPPNADPSFLDASFYRVRVTAPARLSLIASGVEAECQKVGDWQVVTIVAGPTRDFYLAASDRFAVKLAEKVGETRINSYARAGQDAAARLALQTASEAIERFGARLGPYPYSEFDIISAPMQALGIEYPGLTSLSAAMYNLQGQAAGAPAAATLESTTAHEVGHQWFYNLVGNDQPGEPWLDEAVVQYVTGLYYLDRYGQNGYQGFRSSWESRWERVQRADIPIGLPAEKYQGREYGAIVYGRGPLFIEALAQRMGQATFDAFLRDYTQTYRWGIGTGAAFKQMAERHCQCDLSPLFAEWVYGR